MKQYKVIFLDWDDTIGDWSHAAEQALHVIYERYHLNELYETVADFFNTYEPYNLELWSKYGRSEVTKEQLHFERFYYPLMVNNYPEFRGMEKKQLALQMGDEFLQLTNKYFSLLPDVEQVVKYLAAKYPLTIISNGFKEVQYYKFSHSGLAKYFTHTIISEEVGMNKPNPKLFEFALEMNGVTADEALMIGDSYSSDIEGAKAAGIDQLWLCQSPEQGKTATYIVPKLTDIMALL